MNLPVNFSSLFNLRIPPNKLNKYYRERLFELVDFDSTTEERRKTLGNTRYEYVDKLIEDIEKNNSIYQNNGETIGFIYGSFYTILLIFLLKVVLTLIK